MRISPQGRNFVREGSRSRERFISDDSGKPRLIEGSPTKASLGMVKPTEELPELNQLALGSYEACPFHLSIEFADRIEESALPIGQAGTEHFRRVLVVA